MASAFNNSQEAIQWKQRSVIPSLELSELFMTEIFHMIIVKWHLNYNNPTVPLAGPRWLSLKTVSGLTVAWALTWDVHWNSCF